MLVLLRFINDVAIIGKFFILGVLKDTRKQKIFYEIEYSQFKKI